MSTTDELRRDLNCDPRRQMHGLQSSSRSTTAIWPSLHARKRSSSLMLLCSASQSWPRCRVSQARLQRNAPGRLQTASPSSFSNTSTIPCLRHPSSACRAGACDSSCIDELVRVLGSTSMMG